MALAFGLHSLGGSGGSPTFSGSVTAAGFVAANGGFGARNPNFSISLGTAGTAYFYNNSPGSPIFNFNLATLNFASTAVTLDSGSSFISSASIATAGAFTCTNNNSTSLILGPNNNVTQNGKVAWSGTAPTISSGFGTSPSIVGSNGSLAFQINVGTGGVATTGVIGLPAATTGWVLMCNDITTKTVVTQQTASTTTTATIGSFSAASGAATAWSSGDVVNIVAFAY